MPRDKSSRATTKDAIGIQATSQQTRFDLNEHTASKDLDLHTVNVSIGKHDVLTNSHLKLSPGVHYVLVGCRKVDPATHDWIRASQNPCASCCSSSHTMLHRIRRKLLRACWSREQRQSQDRSFASARKCIPVEHMKCSLVLILRVLVLRNAIGDHHDTTAALRVLRSGAQGLKARKELKALETWVEEEAARLQELNLTAVSEEANEAVLMLAEIEADLEAMPASTAELRAKDLLLGLGLTTTTISQPLKSLSGVWDMRIVLVSLLFQPCDILLLDEPTNFLDIPSLLWLESYLQEKTDTTFLLVSHDRTFADSIAEEIIVMRNSKLEQYPGNLTAYEKTRSEQKKRLVRMKEAQDRQKAHMQDTIAGNKKLDERMGMEVGLKGGRFKLNHDLPGYHTNMQAGIEIPQDENTVKMTIPSEPSELRYPGALVLVENLIFKYK
ncbi:hypothetical protein PM082_003820 [Marasmius tenuissimus]|nr:hypothetical protein PM082_003820 [Marasmius tenuissimus]